MADAVFAPSNTILTIIEGMPSVNAINNNPFWNQGMAMLTALTSSSRLKPGDSM